MPEYARFTLKKENPLLYIRTPLKILAMIRNEKYRFYLLLHDNLKKELKPPTQILATSLSSTTTTTTSTRENSTPKLTSTINTTPPPTYDTQNTFDTNNEITFQKENTTTEFMLPRHLNTNINIININNEEVTNNNTNNNASDNNQSQISLLQATIENLKERNAALVTRNKKLMIQNSNLILNKYKKQQNNPQKKMFKTIITTEKNVSFIQMFPPLNFFIFYMTVYSSHWCIEDFTRIM